MFMLWLFNCGKNIDWHWGPLINASQCLSGYEFTDAFFISDLITDLLAICLPIPLVSPLPCLLCKALVSLIITDYTTSNDDEAKTCSHRRPFIGYHVRCHKVNRHSLPPLTSRRSIGASIVRIVYAFQIQAAGLDNVTDVDGISPPSSPQKLRPANITLTLRGTNNAPLLGNARSRHLPDRHQPSFPEFPDLEKIFTILRRQRPQRSLAWLVTVATIQNWD